MATISLNLDTRVSNINGESQVRIRISQHHQSTMIGTGAYVTPEQFIGQLYNPIKFETPDFNNKYNAILAVVKRCEGYLVQIIGTDAEVILSAAEIKSNIMNKQVVHNAHRPAVRKQASTKQVAERPPRIINNRRDMFFNEFVGEFAYTRSTESTKNGYLYALALLREYNLSIGRPTMVKFSDVTSNYVCGFYDWLCENRSENTRFTTINYLRAAWKECRKRGFVAKDFNPFEWIKNPSPEPGEIEYIPIDKVRELLELDLSKQQGETSLERARDIFFICYYMCGINLADVYNMPKMEGNEIVYIRQKIARKMKKSVHLRIEPELEALIKKYEGEEHLFNFCETIGNYNTFRRNLNDRFGRLSKLVGTKINLALCRHTWATTAGMLDIQDGVIDMALGHKNTTILGRHYKQYDWSKVHVANRKMIDHLWHNVHLNSVHVPAFLRHLDTRKVYDKKTENEVTKQPQNIIQYGGYTLSYTY